jgi:hypothetical protein
MITRKLIFLGATVLPLFAAEPADKSHYHLFKPTPVELMRPMSTDRPDKTESPYTVDAGHFQIESDLISYATDHDEAGGADLHGDGWGTSLNLKAGLCNFSDFQVVLFPYTRVRTDDRVARTVSRQSGFGDVLTRLKVNLWGNDGGACAGAVMPFVKWPTSQDQLGNRAIEGGLIIPVTFELGAGFSCGVMTEFDWMQDGGSRDYHPEFINSITVARDIVGDLGAYVEFWSLVSAETGADWVGTVDIGFTYALTENIQFDTGVNIGVTDSASDWNPFLGFSVRF